MPQPINGKHVECFVISVDEVKITMIPWVQTGKGSELSAENIVKLTDVCQRTDNSWYNKCVNKTGLSITVHDPKSMLNEAVGWG